jgi:hypothetical protein
MAEPPISIEVEGIPELRRQLKRAEDGTQDAIKTANKSAAEKVVRSALPNVPVRSGRLKASVRSLASQTSGRAVAGKARVPYAAAIHWGEGSGNINFQTGGSVRRKNRNVRGRPFLWEAADRMLGQVVEEYEGEIDQLLNRTVRE